jgi:prepilin-type N-terminal cleavage/methylation domain-containing protein
MIDKKHGFSLVELLMVLAVIAVVSALVTPHIIGWRDGAKLRGAAGNLKGDLEMAKVNAIKHNNFVAVKFNGNAYEVFVDISDDGDRDADEPLLKTRSLPAGVVFDFSHPEWTFTSNVAKFNGRGTADTGTAILTNVQGQERHIKISSFGRIRVEILN